MCRLLALAAVPCLAAAFTPNPDAVKACQALNQTEKLRMMGGSGEIAGYSRNSGCGNVCGRETFRWDNGPQGFGDNTKPGTSTQWPSTLNMAATFDPDLANAWGTAMGEEWWGKGTNIFEGPGINVARVMQNGRNWEYISGEDPVLGARMAVPLIHGVQQNAMAVAKHYITNNQETQRLAENNVVDETTLMELYGPPFEAAATEGHVASYMCAYNRINGVYACENNHTLNTMLKGRYGFDGFVVSDWGATHSTDLSLTSGLDVEMPKGAFFSVENLQKALAAKVISDADVEERCERILSGWYNIPASRRYPCNGGDCIDKNVSTAAHKALARTLSAASTVLLKNDGGVLPLSAADKSMKIALIGVDATNPYTGGQGSGSVSDFDKVSPAAALAARGFSNLFVEDGVNETAAVAAAAAADVAIVFGSAHAGEGADRANLSLTANIDALVPEVAKTQPRTVVVVTAPGSVLTEWRSAVPAVVTNLLPGEQVGPALMDVLFGDVMPQGKLPVTFPVGENDQGMTEEQYPGVKSEAFVLQANYTEGQIVGYRWYDKHGAVPAFPFGHGLSYGAFAYSGLKVDERTISWRLDHASGLAGACDTPQLYIGYPHAATRAGVPTKVLRYFKKTCTTGADFTYTLTDRDVSNWDAAAKAWKVTRGTYAIYVGASSQDVRLTGEVTI